MLCQISTLLMQMKFGPTKGKKATDVASSLGVSSLQGELSGQWICLSLQPFCLNVLWRNSNSPGRLHWLQMALAWCTKVTPWKNERRPPSLRKYDLLLTSTIPESVLLRAPPHCSSKPNPGQPYSGPINLALHRVLSVVFFPTGKEC